MASPSLSLPGVLFVGEDERARLVAHLGPAAGWMVPKGILGWSHEVSVVARDALGEQIRRDAKIVMPDEQIPQAKMPLTHQAALKSPLVAISGKLTQKLIDAGIRVHTVGADRITSSFYYIAEGGGEAPVRVEGDLVAAVGAMLGDRADNAAIERVLDGLVDRLLRSLSKDRVAELSLELAAALPRAAADGTGTHNVDLDSFERELAKLVAASEKYTPFLEEIAAKIGDTNERRVEVPLYGDARKISQGPFELTVGEQKVALVTHERWLATGPLTEPTAPPARAAAQKTPEPKPAPKAAEPKPAPKAAEPKPAPKAAEPKPAPKAAEPKPITPTPSPAATPRTASSSNLKPVAGPPRPGSTPPPPASQKEPPKETPAEPALPKLEPAPVVILGGAPEPKVEPPPPEPAPTQQSVVSESPKPTPVAAAGIPKGTLLMASAPAPVAAKVADAVVPTPAPTPAPTPKPVPTPAPSSAESLPAVDAHDEDSRLANTQKTKRKEKGGGIPWVLIVVILAAVVAGYRFLIAR